MYRVAKIKELISLIGWRQNFDTADFEIDASLTTSDSGQFYQDIHPLLTLDNVKSIAPEFERVTIPDWVVGTNYTTGQRVTQSGNTYIALRDNVGVDPTTDDQNNPTDWDLYDAFSDWLKQKTEASIIKAVKNIYDYRIKEEAAKSLIENKVLFDGTGRIKNTLGNTNSLVGFEITPLRGFGVTTKIDKIATQFTGGVEDLTLYLFHSSRSEPIRTITLTRTLDDSMEWFTPDQDIFLPYVGGGNDAGGSWYLVYDQNALGANVEAIIKERDWSKRPCSDCQSERFDYENWRAWSKYLEVHPFKTNDDFSGTVLWDVESNLYTYSTNYGLNLQISVHCDISDLIVDQRKEFETYLGLQVAADFIREMAYNPNYNINRTQQNFSKAELLYELDGDSTSYKKSGIKHELKVAMEAISINLDKMSRVCFQCNRRGVRYKSVAG
jgi:hypothetical protein